jgi:hypothetical protein
MKTISSATHTRAYCWCLLIFLTANFFALLGKEREGERERQGERGRGSQGGGEGARESEGKREGTSNPKPQTPNPEPKERCATHVNQPQLNPKS